jgi:indole-3-glycerol phosphate synthase/phosphoribosylanthranilate isomerase
MRAIAPYLCATMMILDKITKEKEQEIKALYAQHDLAALKAEVQPTHRHFYRELAANQPFFICEFKRKSPSEGWIAEHAEVAAQVLAYARAGARAISVLTDTPFFGGTYKDLEHAAAALATLDDQRPLLLQKDFVLDEIQIYLARRAGADMILLIAAILAPERLEALRQVAESLGMGALVEVHDQEELDGIQHLDFPVLGINNRDLKVFRTSLNRVNVLRQQARGRLVISESGIHSYRDFAAVRHAHGFLIGTGLMRQGAASLALLQQPKYLFKACGIRTADLFRDDVADFIGINFSPISKRRMPLDILNQYPLPHNAVAVFYQNSPEDIRATLEKYPFQRVQLYAGDVDPGFVRSLKKKILLAARIRSEQDITDLEAYAPDVDMFILDGPEPGSGTAAQEHLIRKDFPYPFLLAGGIHAGNVSRIHQYDHCIGVDTASGIETDGNVDMERIRAIGALME